MIWWQQMLHAVVAVGGATPAPWRMSRGSTEVSSGSIEEVTAAGGSSTARTRRETLRFMRW